MMKIETFAYFIAVAESLSFTKGAEKSYIAQPAMSRHISMLENEVGVALFQRSSKSVKLTAAGEIFLAGAREMVSLYQQTMADTREADRLLTTKIRIGIDRHEHSLLTQIIQQAKDLDPSLQFSVEQYAYAELLDRLNNEKLDFIFGMPISAEFIASDKVKVISICPFQTDIILYKSHPLSHKDSLSPHEFADETLVTFTEDTGPFAFEKLKPFLENNGFQISNVIYANSLESQVLMVAMGLGVAIIPSICKFQPNTEVKRIPLRNFPAANYTCAYLDQGASSRRLAFTEMILTVSKTMR